MEKKDLEQLYKEKFKDFQETPDEKVWASIEASLNKKSKKRVVPIWWRLGGAAALLALLFYIVNPFGDESGQELPAISDTEQNDAQDNKSNTADPSKNNDFKPSNNLPQLTGVGAEEEGENEALKENESPSKPNYATQKTRENQMTANDTEFASNANEGAPKEEFKENNKANPLLKNEEAVVDAVVNEPTISEKELVGQEKGDLGPEIPISEKEAVASTEVEQEEKQGEKSIFEAIEEQQEDDELALVNNTGSKWSVGPSVAPVYFDSFGEGSPVHSNFASNSKSGNINFSYGVSVAYDLGKRITLRSGVHRVDYGYDTNDIVFSSSLNSSTTEEIDNINFSQSSRNLVVESKVNGAVDNTSAADFIARTPEFEGRMVQQMEYLEVPLEVQYALVDKKIGVNLIGGVSSLFLIDNSVSLESNGLTTQVGEANNVNSMNFSTNVGLGLDYEFLPKMQVRIEPVFKYQLNTFSDAAGNFRPFSLGIYSGLSYKF